MFVLPTDDGIEVFAEQFDELSASRVVLWNGIEHLDECHRIPALGAAPAVLAETCLSIGPEHIPVFVVGMTVEAGLGVEGALVGDFQLVHGIIVDGIFLGIMGLMGLIGLMGLGRLLGDDGRREAAKGESHEDTVEPHLIGIDGLVPVDVIGHGAWLLFQLLHECLHGFQVLLLGQLLIHPSDEMAGADVVKIIIEKVIATNLTLFVDHCVGVELAVVQNVLSAVAQVGVEHTFEFYTHHIAPLGTVGEVEQIRLGRSFHLRACHPLRVVLVGLLL